MIAIIGSRDVGGRSGYDPHRLDLGRPDHEGGDDRFEARIDPSRRRAVRHEPIFWTRARLNAERNSNSYGR